MLKKIEKPDNNVLLLLNEDGSFTQYEGLQLTKESNRQKYEEKLTKSKSKNVNSVAGLAFLKGTWDYLDGKLILATDRPEDVDPKKVHDTILSGKVLLSPSASSSSSKSSKEEVDMNLLSVPKGSIKVGKFMYPKRHPYFFDTPMMMVQPTKTGSFSLRQVLGSFNAHDEYEPVEKYQPNELFEKVFLLTSFPIASYKSKKQKNLKWSKQLGKFIPEDEFNAPTKKKKQVEEVIDIRVMKIKFFSNHTFATLKDDLKQNEQDYSNQKILRGKWNLMGEEKDHLWFQVWRFGFGRSVSGSTYSEGRELTQDDARIYWGTIHQNHIYSMKDNTNTTVFEVRGSVLIGAGLEPLPIGQFSMVEITKEDDDYDENDDDGDDENEDDDSYDENNYDYSNDAFQ